MKLQSFILLVLLVSTVRCASEALTPISIGLVVAVETSGGLQTVNAVKMRVEEVNAEGGLAIGGRAYPVELHVENTANTPEGAMQAVQRLINQRSVAGLIGPNWSHTAIPVANYANNIGLPMISPGSTHPETTRNKPFVFRTAFLDSYQGKVMAGFARDDLQAASAAVLFDIANEYSRELAEVFSATFQELGGRVVAREYYTSGDQHYEQQLARIEASEPDVLFLPITDDDVRKLREQASALFTSTTALGTDSWTPEAVQDIVELEGAYFCAHWHVKMATEDAATTDFIRAYKESFGINPGNMAAQSFDAINLLFESFQMAGSTRADDVRRQLGEVEGYRGITGVFSYQNMDGNPEKPALIMQIGQGQVIPVKQVIP